MRGVVLVLLKIRQSLVDDILILNVSGDFNLTRSEAWECAPSRRSRTREVCTAFFKSFSAKIASRASSGRV